MKKLFLILSVFAMLKSNAQLLVNLQVPLTGIMQKPQLWNLMVTNTSTAPINVHIELMLADVQTGQQVMSGVTQTITLSPGANMLNASMLSPIQYNVLSTAYAVDASANGLLPIGNFDACYDFLKHQTDYVEKIAEQCQELIVEPLSPPQLTYPYDQTAVDATIPVQFSWLPPAPMNLFTNLTYDLDLVELYSGQTAADGIQQNIPIYRQQNITSTSLLYPSTATALQLDKQYAWRITARSNESLIAPSETWQFTLKNFQQGDSTIVSESPFVKLRKDEEPGYAIFSGELKFDYLNETADSTWNIAVYDLSSADRKKASLNMDGISLKRGQNLIRLTVTDNNDFIDKHFYVIEIVNNRKEVWRLRFEYREPLEQNTNNN